MGRIAGCSRKRSRDLPVDTLLKYARLTREIGVRTAFGARAADILWMVGRQAASVIGIGTLLGLAGAFALTRMIRSVLLE